MATIQILDNAHTLALLDTVKQEVEFRHKRGGKHTHTLTLREMMQLTSNMLGATLQLAEPVLVDWDRCTICNRALTAVRGSSGGELECVRCK